MKVTRMEVMHLNRACAYPDLSNLFTRTDVTEATRLLLETMPKLITDQLAMLAEPLPEVAVGEHCSKPYECPFMNRCWTAQPPHHVSTLYSVGKRALVLEEQGYTTIHDLPDDVALDPRPAPAARLIHACEGARTIVAYSAAFERGCLMRLAEALPALAVPLHDIAERLVDLLPVVRNHVYHPDFGGSFGLKSVLPAMVPELSY